MRTHGRTHSSCPVAGLQYTTRRRRNTRALSRWRRRIYANVCGARTRYHGRETAAGGRKNERRRRSTRYCAGRACARSTCTRCGCVTPPPWPRCRREEGKRRLIKVYYIRALRAAAPAYTSTFLLPHLPTKDTTRRRTGPPVIAVTS